MSKQDFLLELGCEELPAGSLKKLSKALGKSIEAELDRVGLGHQALQLFVTPRRLAVIVPELETAQETKVIERQGPSFSSAFDKDGTPTLACMGFARSCGVSADQLQVKETDKGKRVFCRIEQIGSSSIDLLPTIIEQAINKLPIPKPMRWGNNNTAFIRPVHWLVMLLGDNVIPGTILGKTSGNTTVGHRFHHPKTIKIKHAKDYNGLLLSKGYVVADFESRKALIRKQIDELLPSGHRAIMDDTLLDEVTSLVEWPMSLMGGFDESFLSVPKEVLITSMETHQKVFPVESAEGELQPNFIVVSNIESKDPTKVIEGNERVIKARLSDAKFFYENDLKHPLSDQLAKLDHVIFQRKLGTIADKANRISILAAHIAESCKGDTKTAARAGLLAKADLVSEMVYEFPSLQGTMGYYYALNDKESDACAKAIRDHYLPRYSGDQLPDTLTSAAVALADRLDTLVGIFGINLTPTGDRDPYGLRRAAQGVFRIMIEMELPLDLTALLEKAHAGFTIGLPNKEVTQQTFSFIMDRLKYWYLDQQVPPEVFESVLSIHPTQPLDFHHRLLAVRQFQTLPEATALSAANKRVSNILKKAPDNIPQQADDQLFEHDEERNLAKQLEEQSKITQAFYEKSDYTQALSQLACLKEPVDAFFDQVMVMDEDKAKRDNRLALLTSLRHLFTRVADISLLPSP